MPFQIESKGRLPRSVKKVAGEIRLGFKFLPKLNNKLRVLHHFYHGGDGFSARCNRKCTEQNTKPS